MAAPDPLAMVAGVVDRVERRITGLIPNPNIYSDGQVRNLMLRTTGPLFEAWRIVQATAAGLRTAVPAVRGDTRYSEAERQRQVEELTAAASATITAAVNTMQTRADELERGLTPLGDVARPTPVDAAQEARIANLKADMTMVLAALGGADDVASRLLKFLTDANANGDQLTVWVIATSGWANMYVESRSFSVERWVQRLDDTIGQLLTGEAAAARRVLAELRGGDGLGVAIQAAQHWIRMSFGALGVKVVAA